MSDPLMISYFSILSEKKNLLQTILRINDGNVNFQHIPCTFL